MKSDFTYRLIDGIYRIYPESDDAIDTWNQNLWLQVGLLACQFDAFREQCRQNGYSLRKATPSKISEQELISLLEGL